MTQDILQPVRHFVNQPNARYVILGILVAVFAGGGFLGYRFYMSKVQQDAQKVLAEALDEYAVLRLAEDESQLAQAEEMFHEGYRRSSWSTLAPVFLVYKADAQALQGKFDLASQTLADALAKLSKSSPYFGLYEIKKALIDLDAECGVQCSEEPESLKQLEKIASNKSHLYRELAMQYLLEYYTAAGRSDDAKKITNELERFAQNGASGLLGLV